MTLRLAFALCAALFLSPSITSPLRAEDLPTLSLRYMTIEADVIVVGEPTVVNAKGLPTKFKVTRVLKGSPTLAGREVEVDDNGLYSMKDGLFRQRDKDAEKPPVIKQALLFLEIPDADSERYTTVLSGMRALTKAGDMLVPQQLMNPGPQHLLPNKNVKWEAMLEKVQKDLPEIERVREIERIPDFAERNRAIFKWIEVHKAEFGGNWFDESSKSWAPLEDQLFGWIMQSCVPEDCWQALQLSVELNTGSQSSFPSFSSPRGRELLLAKVFDEKQPAALRLKALREMGAGRVFWFAPSDEYPTATVVTSEEQKSIIKRVVPLLKHEDAEWREAAVRCVMCASWSSSTSTEVKASTQAVPDLLALYRSEQNANVREAVVQALRRIETDAFWQKLTGNPQGIVVIVNCSEIGRDRIKFHLNLFYTRAAITEMPMFRLTKLAEAGKVAEVRTITPTPEYPAEPFTKGWESSQGMIALSIPTEHVDPGRWRVTLEGLIGKEAWRSEFIEITVPEQKKE